MTSKTGLYGFPPPALTGSTAGAIQFSPLVPNAPSLADQPPASFTAMIMLAPPGTVERRYALALSLLALEPGGRLTAMGHKDKGGSRLRAELEAFGCTVAESSKKHHRICVVLRPAELHNIELAVAEGGPQFVLPLGLWSQPGVFSWNRADPGSAFLLQHLPKLSGKGADLGCGVGYLAHGVLASPAVTSLLMLDADGRAIEAARRNVDDPRAQLAWADVRDYPLEGLDFVVMNPPFHDGGAEDKALGQQFILKARNGLRTGSTLWLVANRHLPYEQVLGQQFKHVTLKAETGGYKVYEARR